LEALEPCRADWCKEKGGSRRRGLLEGERTYPIKLLGGLRGIQISDDSTGVNPREVRGYCAGWKRRLQNLLAREKEDHDLSQETKSTRKQGRFDGKGRKGVVHGKVKETKRRYLSVASRLSDLYGRQSKKQDKAKKKRIGQKDDVKGRACQTRWRRISEGRVYFQGQIGILLRVH